MHVYDMSAQTAFRNAPTETTADGSVRLEEHDARFRLWLARLRHREADDASTLEYVDLGDIKWLLRTDDSRQAFWTATLHEAFVCRLARVLVLDIGQSISEQLIVIRHSVPN